MMLHVRTNDICVLRGIRGVYLGHAMYVGQYNVQRWGSCMRAETRDDNYVGGIVETYTRHALCGAGLGACRVPTSCLPRALPLLS